MGAWSEDAFGNDTACDWAADFIDEPSLDRVHDAIEAVLQTDGYLESDPACECLVACEIIARLNGQWGLRNSYSQAIDEWVTANPTNVPKKLKTAALKAIERILGDESELAELWVDDGSNQQWHQAIDDLRNRLAH